MLNKKKFIVEAIESNHTVPTLSYGFTIITKKLKEMYKHLNGSELSQLKKNGEEITYDNKSDVLLFVGDTDYKIFENLRIFDFKNIMIECTFFDDKDFELSISRGHIHWKNLKNIVASYPNINFNIMHISPRHLRDYPSYLKDFQYKNMNFLY